MKRLMLALTLLFYTGNVYGFDAVVDFIINGPITDQCEGGDPAPDGIPVYIFRDLTNDGPSIDDGTVCGDDLNCMANYSSFPLLFFDGMAVNDVPWMVTGFSDGSLNVYLLICLDDIYYYTESVEIVSGPQEIYIGGSDGVNLFCVEGACGDFCLPPMQPYDLTASDNDCDGILVTWQHDLFDVCGFEIRRDSILVHTFDEVPQTLEYFDEEAGGGEHVYHVRAIRCCPDESTTSALSSPISGFQPTVPDGIGSIWIDPSGGGIRICWTDVETEDGYRILRNGMILVTVNSNGVSYEDFGPPPGITQLLYQVIPFNQCGDGPAASVIWVRPPEPPLVANPPELDFGVRPMLVEYDLPVTVRNTTAMPITLAEAITQMEAFSVVDFVSGELSPGDSIQITVRFYPTASFDYHDTLMVVTSLSSFLLEIPLHGVGADFYLSFPNTSIVILGILGTPATATVTLLNGGEIDAIIDTVYFTVHDDVFSVTPLSIALPVASQQEFEVTFTPMLVDAYASYLCFVHNVPPEMEICIPVLGDFVIPDADENPSGVPQDYYLAQAYPNPFNPSTTISFGLPQESQVSLAVFDVSGRLIQNLSDRTLPAGVHSIEFNGNNLPSGVYFYRLTANHFTASRKMVLLK